MSFAQELQKIYSDKRAYLIANKDENLSRRQDDIKLFFEKEVEDGAKDKMLTRAHVGRPTGNILEYSPSERFYVDDSSNVVRYTQGEVNYANYRIHDIVGRDHTFKTLLEAFEQELSGEEAKITFSCWKPNVMMCVIEAVWGRNKYHTIERNKIYADDNIEPSTPIRLTRGRKGRSVRNHIPMSDLE